MVSARVSVIAAAGFAICPAAASAAAAPPVAPELRVEEGEGAKGCIDGASLAQAVEARLGRKVFEAREHDGRLVVRLEAASRGRWRLAVTLSSIAGGEAAGARVVELAADQCGDLLEPLGLIVALSLAPHGLPAATVPVPPPILRAEARPEAAAAPPAWPRWRWGLAAAAGAERVPAPVATPTLRLRASVTHARALRLDLALAAGAPGMVPGERMAHADASRLGLGVDVCRRLVGSSVIAVHLCAGATLDLVAVRGDGFSQNQRARHLVPSSRASLEVEVPLAERWSAFVRLEGGLPLVRRDYVFTTESGEQATLFRTPAISAAALAGAALSL